MTLYDPYRARARGCAPPPGDPANGRLHVHAHVDRYPPFVNAGAEWMLHAMLRHLVRSGHRVTVATAVERRALVDGVDVWPARYSADVAAGCDVLVGHLLWTNELRDLQRRLGCVPLLYLVHNDSQVAYWGLVPDDVTALVYNSEWIERAHAGWGGPGLVVRPPCLVADYEVDRDPDADWVTLVNPIPAKGSDLLWRLALVERRRQFAVVGGAYGTQRQWRAGDPPNITYRPPTGRIADDVYRHTRVLLAPSEYESWGRVAVEAMCSGIPVIAHPTPGLTEALGGAGWFVDRYDDDGWRQALALLDDPTVYAAASLSARARARALDLTAAGDLAAWLDLVRCAAGGVASPSSVRHHPALEATR